MLGIFTLFRRKPKNVEVDLSFATRQQLVDELRGRCRGLVCCYVTLIDQDHWHIHYGGSGETVSSAELLGLADHLWNDIRCTMRGKR